MRASLQTQRLERSFVRIAQLEADYETKDEELQKAVIELGEMRSAKTRAERLAQTANDETARIKAIFVSCGAAYNAELRC